MSKSTSLAGLLVAAAMGISSVACSAKPAAGIPPTPPKQETPAPAIPPTSGTPPAQPAPAPAPKEPVKPKSGIPEESTPLYTLKKVTLPLARNEEFYITQIGEETGLIKTNNLYGQTEIVFQDGKPIIKKAIIPEDIYFHRELKVGGKPASMLELDVANLRTRSQIPEGETENLVDLCYKGGTEDPYVLRSADLEKLGKQVVVFRSAQDQGEIPVYIFSLEGMKVDCLDRISPGDEPNSRTYGPSRIRVGNPTKPIGYFERVPYAKFLEGRKAPEVPKEPETPVQKSEVQSIIPRN